MGLMLRILLVDDDESLRHLLAFQIKQDFSFVVDEASSGNEAINLIKLNEKYCLIISDYNMPDGNGKDLQNFLTERKIDSYFFFYTSETEASVNPAHEKYIGLIQKPHIDILFKELVKAICITTTKKNGLAL